MLPGTKYVGDLFFAERRQPLSTRPAFEDASELAVVKAGVIDGRQLQIERLGVCEQQHLLARLCMLVQPAMSRFHSQALQTQLAVIAAKHLERGEIAVVRLQGNEWKMSDCRQNNKAERCQSPHRMQNGKHAERGDK